MKFVVSAAVAFAVTSALEFARIHRADAEVEEVPKVNISLGVHSDHPDPIVNVSIKGESPDSMDVKANINVTSASDAATADAPKSFDWQVPSKNDDCDCNQVHKDPCACSSLSQQNCGIFCGASSFDDDAPGVENLLEHDIEGLER